MELKVPKSLMVVLWVIGVGLVLNGVQPFLSTPAVAYGNVQKIAICSSSGVTCADVGGKFITRPNALAVAPPK